MKIKDLFTRKYIPLTVGLIAAVLLVVLAVVFAFLWPRTAQDGNSSDMSSEPYSSSDRAHSEVSSETSSLTAPELEITSHKSTDITTVSPFTVFSGKSDPAYPLLLNGNEVERDALGNFNIELELQKGANNFVFSHKDRELTYIVRYRYVIINSYSPSGDKSFSSGAAFEVSVSARRGSTVTAYFNGNTITLSPADTAGGDEEQRQDETFITYSGSFELPSDNLKDLSLGKVTFSASYGEYSEKAYSGNITCKALKRQTVGEVVAYSAETFNGDTSDDASRPTNNYFPKGTVDYVVGRAYNGDKEYLILRCGRRVYVDKKIVPGNGKTVVSKEYVGTLPDTNALSIASLNVDTRFTTLTFNTEWKAPFFLDILPQSYDNPSKQNYSVSAFTANYVEITFCYARGIDGIIDIGQYNPVFTSAEVTQAGGNTVLRLYLRRTGGFYGWDAFYNSDGQLVFKFLHPAQVSQANNAYGADLSGVKILIDVGHGGIDTGAVDYNGNYSESERNLALALKLKAELQTTGATVVLNRSGDTTITADARCQNLKQQSPDLCIAIHHDSNASARPNGFGAFYSTPFSYSAARFVYNRTINTGIYDASAVNNRNRLEWHYYFVARMSNCPVVLTENGFMSNSYDMSHITSDSQITLKAKAIAAGTVDYFLSIKQNLPVPPVDELPSSSGESSSDTTPPPSSSSSDESLSTSSPSSVEQPSSSPSSDENSSLPSSVSSEVSSNTAPSSSSEVESEETSHPENSSSQGDNEKQDPEDGNKDNSSSQKDTSHET